MKRLKGFIIFLYIFLTMLVLIIQPAMHKPVAIENVNFKIKEQLMHPKQKKVSDFMVSIKFYRANKTVVQKTDTCRLLIKTAAASYARPADVRQAVFLP